MSKELKNQIDPKKINNNDLMAFVNYVKVTDKTPDGLQLIVADLDNTKREIRITGKDLIQNAYSADQFGETKKVSKTEAAEILITSHNKPLTVCFVKEENKDGVKEERLLRGRLIKHEALLGRSMVEDLDVDDKNRVRLESNRVLGGSNANGYLLDSRK